VSETPLRTVLSTTPDVHEFPKVTREKLFGGRRAGALSLHGPRGDTGRHPSLQGQEDGEVWDNGQMSDVTEPAVRELMNAGDRERFYAVLTADATLSDDGIERNLDDWVDREIFSSNGHLEVEAATDGGLSLTARYHNDTWGEMRTRWHFVVTGNKITRLETGQA